MTLGELVRRHANDIREIAAVHGARNVRLFGFAARAEDDEKSDIDFLVELDAGRSLLDLGGLQFDLQQLLGHHVDVVTERGLKDRLRDRVFKDAVAF